MPACRTRPNTARVKHLLFDSDDDDDDDDEEEEEEEEEEYGASLIRSAATLDL